MRNVYFLVVFALVPILSWAGGLVGDVLNQSIPKFDEARSLDEVHKQMGQPLDQAVDQPVTTNGGLTQICLTRLGACLLDNQVPLNTPCYCSSANGAIYGYAK